MADHTPVQESWRDRLRQEELKGFAFAFKARTIALGVVVLWVLVSSTAGRLPMLMGAAALFMLVGWIAYAGRNSRHALLIQGICAVLDVAIVVAAIWLHEPISRNQIAGAAAIFSGLLITRFVS